MRMDNHSDVVELARKKGYEIKEGMFYDDIYSNVILGLIKENDELILETKSLKDRYDDVSLKLYQLKETKPFT